MKYPNIDDVKIFKTRGPWQTKSGGQLNVKFAIPFNELQEKYLHYEKNELDKIPAEMRGLRLYTVNGLAQGKIGGGEFHRIREEMVFGVSGRVSWTCEDILGNTKTFVIDQEFGIWMPPFILHTYEVLENQSQFLVVANTLFNPDDPNTHDTYSREEFEALKSQR